MSEMPLRSDSDFEAEQERDSRTQDGHDLQQIRRRHQSTLETPGSNEEPERRDHTMRLMIKEIVETVVFILLAFFIVRGMIQNFKIEGHSMDPTLHDGQYILVNKLVYFHFDLNAPLRLLPGNDDLPRQVVYPFHMPRRGDIVVFHAPSEQRDYIKRVIGLPGERVEIKDGKVFVNGQLLDEAYLNAIPTTCDGLRPTCDLVVPEGTVYVLGDNRPNSSDSRSWETLPLDNIIGQAWISYWPQEYWGVINTPSYATGNR